MNLVSIRGLFFYGSTSTKIVAKKTLYIYKLLSVSKGRGCKEVITGEAKTWLISVAAQKPKVFGYSVETRTSKALTTHIRKYSIEVDYNRHATITESGVYRILDKAKIKPFRIQHYCERGDPDFDDKMHNILFLYKQLSFQFDENGKFLHFEDDEP